MCQKCLKLTNKERREEEKAAEPKYNCKECTAPITRHSKSGLCQTCFSLTRTKMPTEEVLEEDVKKLSVIAMSKKYGVSDATINKWMRLYGIKRVLSWRRTLPSEEQLKKDLVDLRYDDIAKKYNATKNQINKWIKHYNLQGYKKILRIEGKKNENNKG